MRDLASRTLDDSRTLGYARGGRQLTVEMDGLEPVDVLAVWVLAGFAWRGSAFDSIMSEQEFANTYKLTRCRRNNSPLLEQHVQSSQRDIEKKRVLL